MASWQPKRTTVLPKPDLKGAVIHFEGDPDSNGVLSDLSGNSNDGTLNGRLSAYNSGVDKIIEFHGGGQGRVIVSSSATIDNLSAHTYQFLMNQKSAGEGGFGRILVKGDKHQLYNSGGNYSYAIDYSDGFGVWQFPVILNNDLFIQLSHTHSDATDLPVCYMNGAQVTVAVSVAKTGSKDSDAGLDLLIGNNVALDRTSDIFFSNYKYYPSKLSADDNRDEYLRFTLPRIIRHTPRTEYAVTAAPLAAPNQVGPWQLTGGSAEWLDDGSERYLQSSVVSSISYKSSSQAYGFWYFKFTRTNQDTRPLISFIINQGRNAYTTAGTNGYLLFISASNQLQLYRITNGAVTLILNSAANWFPDTGTYEIAVVRRVTDGQITPYTREANHTTWTSPGSIVDNNHTTSNFVQFYTSSTSAQHQFYFPYSWPHGDSLTPNDVPFLAD